MIAGPPPTPLRVEYATPRAPVIRRAVAPGTPLTPHLSSALAALSRAPRMDSLFGESPWGRVPRHRQGRQPGQERRGQCNCRNSRCLKLYCECFASGQYCLGCNCQSCHNNPENNDKRLKAIDVTLER